MARISPRKASHDPLFDAPARARFFKRIGVWMSGDALADALEAAGLPRPSQGNASYRSMLELLVEGREPWQVAEIARTWFNVYYHLPAAPPADEDGYLSALLEDAPALCAPAAAPTHTTHCHGVRVFWSQCVRPPVVATHSLCEVLDV